MNDRVARLLAAVSIAVAAIAVVIAVYALSIIQASSDELHALTDGVQRALAAQRASDVPLRRPPPALDPGD